MSTVEIPGLPSLRWTPHEGRARVRDGDLILTAAAGVDWTNDASGREFESRHTSSSLGFRPEGDFQLSARVRVDSPRTTFDAGALTLWADEEHWAKLCFEFSPQGTAMVVSVVTNGYSDDVNSAVVDADAVYLRVSRLGPAFAFHSSADGRVWDFVRLFRLYTDEPVEVGFMAQAPDGERAVATFSEMSLSFTTIAELRDGS